MLTGPPLPLPAEFPLRQLIPLINDKEHAGAWVRDSGVHHRLTITADGRCAAVTIGQDLGELLRCCTTIVLRAGSGPVTMSAEALIQWRALRVVTSMPHLLCPERLQEIFPAAQVESTGFSISTERVSPEDVLASCLTHGIPVVESHIVYHRRSE
jgi:hypothetical protein